jgi:tetratricopeptide (TPR) repeat protein
MAGNRTKTGIWAAPSDAITRAGLRPRNIYLALPLLVFFWPPQILAQNCVPPESMKPRLQGKPNAQTLTDLGVWFAEQKNYACAANAFATSLQTEPNQKDVAHIAFMFGVSLYFSGDAKEGIAALQEAEKLGYNDIKLHLILAEALDAAHDTAGAETQWRAALEIDPEYSEALDNLSTDLIADGNFNGTIEVLEIPRLLSQRTAQQSLNLGLAYAKLNKLDEAVRVLRDGLNTTPDSLALANELADVLVRMNRREEAAVVLEVARARQASEPASTTH